MKEEESQKLRDEELKYEQKLFETCLQFQSELKEASKLQQAQGSGSGSGSGDIVAGLQAKLPKSNTTKFDGTFQDWPRFWGQFCEAIVKSSIAGVTKFSYLRELWAPKVKASIGALPFTPKGYLRALSILKDKYGKESKMVKAYKEILELPVISGVNVINTTNFAIKKIRKQDAITKDKEVTEDRAIAMGKSAKCCETKKSTGSPISATH